MWLREIKNSLFFLIIFFILLGIIYPFFLMSVGKIFFKDESTGSFIVKNNELIGSLLIGQNFTDKKYFHGRPSMNHYDPMQSGGSNADIQSDTYLSELQKQIKLLQRENRNKGKVPVDLIEASGSGLDPEISTMAANYQVERIARARHLSVKAIQDLISQNEIKPVLGIFGERRVNVLKLNLALDAIEDQSYG